MIKHHLISSMTNRRFLEQNYVKSISLQEFKDAVFADVMSLYSVALANGDMAMLDAANGSIGEVHDFFSYASQRGLVFNGGFILMPSASEGIVRSIFLKLAQREIDFGHCTFSPTDDQASAIKSAWLFETGMVDFFCKKFASDDITSQALHPVYKDAKFWTPDSCVLALISGVKTHSDRHHFLHYDNIPDGAKYNPIIMTLNVMNGTLEFAAEGNKHHRDRFDYYKHHCPEMIGFEFMAEEHLASYNINDRGHRVLAEHLECMAEELSLNKPLRSYTSTDALACIAKLKQAQSIADILELIDGRFNNLIVERMISITPNAVDACDTGTHLSADKNIQIVVERTLFIRALLIHINDLAGELLRRTTGHESDHIIQASKDIEKILYLYRPDAKLAAIDIDLTNIAKVMLANDHDETRLVRPYHIYPPKVLLDISRDERFGQADALTMLSKVKTEALRYNTCLPTAQCEPLAEMVEALERRWPGIIDSPESKEFINEAQRVAPEFYPALMQRLTVDHIKTIGNIASADAAATDMGFIQQNRI